MFKDNLSDETKLSMVANEQSYSPKSRYLGMDEFRCANIRKGQRLYAFKPAFISDNLCRGDKSETIDFCWFFDQATFDRLVKDGKFNSTEVAEYLQVDYWKDRKVPNAEAVYNDSILAFDLKEDIRVPVGECLANDQFGNGGAHQCFIPKDMVEQLQREGLLAFNKNASLIKKGTDNVVPKNRCNEIDESIVLKRNFCYKNNQKHCTVSLFAAPAEIHEPISSAPFNCDHRGKYSTYDYAKEAKNNLSSPITGSRAGKHFVKANEKTPDETFLRKKRDNKIQKTNPAKKADHLMNTVSVSKLDVEYDNEPLAGLYNLQKYLNISERTEDIEEIALSNEQYCL